ncbi:hypothetical protein BABINDRAFT_42454, partial [Babjeviella inositovora NRRL Y-12698]
ENERAWLIERIIKPEYPKILDTLHECVEALEDGTPNQLALSSFKSEAVKGIIVRQRHQLTKVDFILKMKGSHKSSRYESNKPIDLSQIPQALQLVFQAVERAEVLFSLTNSENIQTHMNALLEAIAFAKLALQIPEKQLFFPWHVIDSASFTPVLPPTVSLDFFVHEALLGFEVRTLEPVTESPWCTIGPDGKSYVDQMREKVKNRTQSVSNVRDGKSVPGGGSHHGATSISSFFPSFRKSKPEDYLTKCSTYNNSVVMELEKCEVSIFDPVLMKCGTKLDGLHHLVSNLYKNLKDISE